MTAFKAWAMVALFSGLGMAVAMGYRLPRDHDCIGRCRLDTLAALQERIGDPQLAMILFACGWAGFIYYSIRG